MKRCFSIVGVLAVVLIGFAGCSKNSAKKVLVPEDVAKSLSSVLCEKYLGCQPKDGAQALNKDQCLQNITTGISDRIKAKAELKVEQGMVDNCVKAITSAACEVLSSDTPPAGCEFLQ
ncbi:MAG: hypothetical protein IPJ69_09430 [Deltaproteobacteria bacterium]|nr:MAG: hypothetical protein IPJ69_09430 [Deltaproteobacteria bacterium]